jgi:uncharacterized membrane protein SirB2
VSKYLVCRFKAVFLEIVTFKLPLRGHFSKEKKHLKLTPALKRTEMSLLNSVILIIAFLFLVFTFWPGALAVVIVWLLLQFIKKRRRLNEMQGQ